MKKIAAALLSTLVVLSLMPLTAGAAVTWTGLGASGLASDANNWSPSAVPSSSDDIVLDATSSSNLTWDAGINSLPDTVASWTQTSGYAGTVTVATVFGTVGFTNLTVLSDLTVNGGGIAHKTNNITEAYALRVTVQGNLNIGTNGSINGNLRGYAAKKGPGNGSVGGGFGGVSGTDPTDIPVNTGTNLYGSILAPRNIGSGGGSAGGGCVRLIVWGTTDIKAGGNIAANGLGAFSGSGGSVFLQTGNLTGAGTIQGDATTAAGHGGGGGGRVAVILTNPAAVFPSGLSIHAFGAHPAPDGQAIRESAPGTVYLQTGAQAAGAGKVIVYQTVQTTAGAPVAGVVTYIPPNFQGTYGGTDYSFTDDLSKAKLSMTNAANVTIATNVTIGDIETFASTKLDLNGYTLTVKRFQSPPDPDDTKDGAIKGTVVRNGGLIVWLGKPKGNTIMIR